MCNLNIVRCEQNPRIALNPLLDVEECEQCFVQPTNCVYCNRKVWTRSKVDSQSKIDRESDVTVRIQNHVILYPQVYHSDAFRFISINLSKTVTICQISGRFRFYFHANSWQVLERCEQPLMLCWFWQYLIMTGFVNSDWLCKCTRCTIGNAKTSFVGDVAFEFAFVQCERSFKYCTQWYILAFDVTMVTVVTAVGWT